MALWKSDIATGKQTYPFGDDAYDSIAQRAEFEFDAAAANGDIIDLGVLPARTIITDARLLNPAGATVGVVAILSGTPGKDTNDDGTARTLDTANPIIDADTKLATDYACLLDPSYTDRSIGVSLGAAVAAGAGKIVLQLGYVAI